ncbi:DUF3426 domain-containing protein [Microbulbifer sp. OS29]|uniref:DUF3426 domain-containing protein n=1 Tax=Microbulbifer okhotskensis TaxID=2926617 RepID=A0A9X2EKP8_9GAMM|nr:DUF3426 domain-containing protein [Microbulbifer okhotskensis]MCO1333446.1 DUF3426 domain-containing protein [Microbulbifer okhotskensis]
MSQLVTRCPHCSTSFHINDQQLRAARGAVRCGSCLQVFRADENIVFAESDADSRSDLEALLEDDDFLIHDDIELDDDEPLEEPPERNPAAPAQVAEAELAQETDDNPAQELIGDAFGDHEWQELEAATEEELEPEEDIGSVLKPDGEDVPDFDPSPLPQNSPPEIAPVHTSHSGGTLEYLHTNKPAGHNGVAPPENESRQEPFFGSESPEPEEPQREQLISAIQPAPLEVSWGRPSKKRAVSPWLWRALIPLSILGITVQIAYFQFDSLSRKQPWRNFYAFICPLLNCTLPQLQDTKAIQASNLMVRTHPQLEGALIVDAVLLNTAPYPQPFPNLRLNFSDLKNKAVASRRFTPGEYLQGELAGRQLMPQGSPIHIAIEVVDPGTEAVNYELNITH